MSPSSLILFLSVGPLSNTWHRLALVRSNLILTYLLIQPDGLLNIIKDIQAQGFRRQLFDGISKDEQTLARQKR
jgi:hypothetical protein